MDRNRLEIRLTDDEAADFRAYLEETGLTATAAVKRALRSVVPGWRGPRKKADEKGVPHAAGGREG